MEIVITGLRAIQWKSRDREARLLQFIKPKLGKGDPADFEWPPSYPFMTPKALISSLFYYLGAKNMS